MNLYSVGTYDWEECRYTPQDGLSVPSINVPLATVRQIFRELRECGYSCHRYREVTRYGDVRYDCNDSNVLVERTEGRSEAEILESWER